MEETLVTEKVMALHSSTLAWKIPWMEEPDRLQSMASRRVRHNWATSLSLFTFMHWRRKWQATHSSVLAWRIPGMGEPVGLPSMGRTESDTNWSNLAAAAASLVKSNVVGETHAIMPSGLTLNPTSPASNGSLNLCGYYAVIAISINTLDDYFMPLLLQKWSIYSLHLLPV